MSQSATIDASSSSVFTGRSTISKRPSARARVRSDSSTSAAMRRRFIVSFNSQDKLDGDLRFLKKHRVALIALAVYHFVFFFPTLFMGRIASPNDVFYNFEPWKSVRQV